MCANRKGLILGCIITISLVSGIIALILSLVDIKNVSQKSPNKYGMVFDAGSSHTSLFIYQWPADKENDTGIVSQIHVCNVQGPGLSAYADNPAQAGESLKMCMEEAMTVIPAKQQMETTTLLGATAGMRLLRMKNETKTQSIFEEVSKTLKQYPVNFQGARILTGNEEGSLGWITVNYLLGTFIKYSFLDSWMHPQQSEIYGAMDLGGASTQMTFHPTGIIDDKDTEMFFRLYGYNYTIYTHSYLCYGQDQALKRLLADCIKHSSGNVTTHPCYPRGYRANVSLASVYNSACVAHTSENLTATVLVEGTGDPEKCRSALMQIFNFSACTNKTSCSFDGIYQPHVHGQYYAFSAFYYTFSFLNLTSGQSLSVANRTVWDMCSQEWSKLVESFPLENRRHLLEYCGSAMYIFTLLLDGYKFDDQTWNNIHFHKQAGNTDIGWTLGYMLNLTNRIPSEAGGLLKGHGYNLWVAAIFFIVLSIAGGLVAVQLHCFCRNKCSGQGSWT
ncbi:hypothetical protein FKM82_005351 [Ascaphus truei]